jgi:Ssp1 endopeptidase immunity protein Rap1a
MSMRIVIGAVILALVGDKALSQQLLRSYELAAHCKTVDAVCKAYLGGYMDAAELYQLWITTQRTPLPDNKPPFCPASVGVNEFANSYVRYIEANPAKLDLSSATTLLDMLTTNFRCPTPYTPLR